MKRRLQFALPLLVPAALLLGSPAFSQGRGNGGDRGGGNGRGNGGARQEQRMGGMDRGGPGREMNRGMSESRGMNQNRGFEQRQAPQAGNMGGGQNRGFEQRQAPERVYNPSSQRPDISSRQDRGYESQQRNPGRVYSPSNQAPQRDYGRNDSRDRNYGSSSGPSQGGVRTPSPDRRDRVYTGSAPDRRYADRSYGGSRGGYYGGNRYPSRSYQSPVRWNYRYPVYGQRVTHLSVGFHTIPFGGYNYCFSGGIWYRPYGGYYSVIAPPIGISINILPFGYTRVFVGPNPYYYYGGIYYMPRNNGYVVVDPPLGAKLPALPVRAQEVFINGQRLFEDNGTYYMEEYNIQGQRLYTVVGVHGVLDQGQIDQISQGTGYNASYDAGLITVLPANCRRVTISGQEYYLSPEDVYYQEITDGANVSYQVVGM